MKKSKDMLKNVKRLGYFIGTTAFFIFATPVCSQSFEINRISERSFVHFGVNEERSTKNLGDNANIGFIIGDKCVLVVDAGGSFKIGVKLREAIRSVTDKPICYVVITHAHPDHFFGASAFLKDRPKYIGHEGLYSRLKSRQQFYKKSLFEDLGKLAEGSDIIKPELIIKAGETLSLFLGSTHEILIKAWRPAHTDHDLSVFDKKEGVFWTGDLLFVGHIPILDSNIKSFISVLEELYKMPIELFIPGHGVPKVNWPEAIEKQKNYFHILLEQTRNAIRSGTRLMDGVHSIGWSEKNKWINFENFHRRNVTTAWTELEWE